MHGEVSAFAQGKICCLVNCSGFPLCQYDLREPLSFNNAENKSPLKYMHLKELSSQPDCLGAQAPSLLPVTAPLSFKDKLGYLLLQEACPDSSWLGVISLPSVTHIHLFIKHLS